MITFPSISRLYNGSSGKSFIRMEIQFADLRYQRVIDQLNGLPMESYSPRLTWSERFNFVVFGLGLLVIDTCFACAMGDNITAMPAFLLSIAVPALGLLYLALWGK